MNVQADQNERKNSGKTKQGEFKIQLKMSYVKKL